MKKTIKLSALMASIVIILFANCTKEGDEAIVGGVFGKSCVNNRKATFLSVGHWWDYSYIEPASTFIDTTLFINIIDVIADVYHSYIDTITAEIGNHRYQKECNDTLYTSREPGAINSDVDFILLNRFQDQKWKTYHGEAEYEVVTKDTSVYAAFDTLVCDMLYYHRRDAGTTDTIFFSNEVGFIKYYTANYRYDLFNKNF